MGIILSAKGVHFKDMIQYPELAIEEGAVTFITGESGSGKTTLLRLFNGIASPAAGEILYHGVNINDLDTVKLRREVLLVNQTIYLFDKTIRENFAEFYRYRDMSVPDDKEIKPYLSLCCADFPLDTVCTTMSGGERHRIYIAICLSLIPKVLMLDEPTSALDAQNASSVMSNVTGFCREKQITLLVVSHDRQLAAKFGDKVITLKGRG